ncbi:MAG: toll/interleukin-1 receptor domain-containing protein [Candidatus Heimdallarchaeota archaeon]
MAIIFSVFLTLIEIVLERTFFYGYFEIDLDYFFDPFLFLFSGYFYILLLIFAGYELDKDKRKFEKTKLLKVLGYVLVLIHIAFFFVLKMLIRLLNPDLSSLFDMIALYLSYAIMPAIFIIFFNFGVKNEKNYGNYATSFAILYLIYFIITLLYHFLIAPKLISVTSVLIIGTTLTTLQILLVYLAAGYLFFFGIRIKLPHFILLTLFWLYYNIYHQLSSLITEYTDEYLYMLMIIIICLLGIITSIRYFELGKRLKRGMRVFISHSVEDFNRYRIEDVVNFLRMQKKIGHVYFCEADLIGNIDKWMKKTIQKSQVLVFISTQNSLKSKDSIFELNLAREKELHLIPILGVGLRWEDLEKLDLHREFGLTYTPMEFEKFLGELYQYVLKYRKDKKAEIIEEKT